MCDSGVSGVFLEDWFENLYSCLLSFMRLLEGRSAGKKREGIKDLRFRVVGVCRREFSHGAFVFGHSFSIWDGAKIPVIEKSECVDEFAFSAPAATNLLCSPNLLAALPYTVPLDGRVPQLVKIRHCKSPVGDRAVWVFRRHLSERSLRSGIGERVKQGHASCKFSLNVSFARRRE